MSVTKIQRVKSVTHAVNYILKNNKTESHLINSYSCSPKQVKQDFEDVLNQYNTKERKDRKLNSRMIVQSYDPDENITPEQAHEYGKEFAQNYLNDEYQYIIATHKDTNHIHNHIIFNDINYKTLEIFDSSRENTLHRMRAENNLINERYSLKIIEKTKQNHKYLSHGEYDAKSKGTSFKARLENDIDLSIENTKNYQDFLKDMKEKGYEFKEGKHLAFKSPGSKKFMRTKTLGFNYLENSIKYRIENEDYIPFKPKVMERDWIDKSQEKFQENIGLYKWATLQNINYLHEVNNVLTEEDITINEFMEDKNVQDNFASNIEKELSNIDNEIIKLENRSDCFDVYADSYEMMITFKQLNNQEEKDEYKKEHFPEFKKYDLAKKNISMLKKGYNIKNKEQLENKITSLHNKREELYETFNLNKKKYQNKEIYKEKELNEEKRKEKEQQKKNKDMEL